MNQRSTPPSLASGCDRTVSRRPLGRLLLVSSLALAAALPARAVGFSYGDIFAAVGNGQVKQYDKNFNYIQTLNTGLGGYTTGMAFDSSGKLYVTDFSVGRVSTFSKSDASLLGTFGGSYATPESLVFDKTGNVYVGQVGGGTVKLDAGGNSLASFPTNRTDWIDLAADQHTLYLSDESQVIRRFDTSTNTFLSNFATLPGAGEGYALRLLSDGGLLIADGDNVKRLDASGNVIQTYGVTGESTFFALNLDPDGKSFFSGNYSSGNFYKFDIATGNVLGTVNTGAPGNFFGLAVYGEKTEAGGGPPPPPTFGAVPEPSTYALFGAVGLLVLAARRYRRDRATA